MALRPSLRDLDLNLLLLFDVLMSTRKLTATAERLGITQSAASQALGRLRRSFDDELFVRSRNGMLPTPRAEELARPVAEALALLDQALEDSAAFDPASSRRAFRVAFGSTGELALLPPIVAAVARESATVRVLSVPATAEQGLELVQRGEIELCFDYAPPAERRIQRQKLADEEMVVIARQAHPRLNGSVSVEQFFQERHVLLSVTDERRALIERVIQRDGVSRQVIAEVSHYESIPAVVLQTDALALVPRSLARTLPFKSGIQILAAPLPLPSLPLYAMWHGAFDADGGHQWLRKIIAASFRSSRSR